MSQGKTVDSMTKSTIVRMVKADVSVRVIARAVGASTSTVQAVKQQISSTK